jgi:hypothetical protein
VKGFFISCLLITIFNNLYMMKRLLGALLVLFSFLCVSAQHNLKLDYYLPKEVKYSGQIPVPSAVIGHEVGEWHVTHDKLVNYMKAIATANPSRVKLQISGTTYEGRQQVLLIITSPANHARLEEIRTQHLQLCDPSVSSRLDPQKMPAVLLMGYSVHGNESSGANASLLSAYHLAAAQGPEIDELLNNVVVLLDPSFNPDGLQRFSTWVNQHKSKNLFPTPTAANSARFGRVAGSIIIGST